MPFPSLRTAALALSVFALASCGADTVYPDVPDAATGVAQRRTISDAATPADAKNKLSGSRVTAPDMKAYGKETTRLQNMPPEELIMYDCAKEAVHTQKFGPMLDLVEYCRRIQAEPGLARRAYAAKQLKMDQAAAGGYAACKKAYASDATGLRTCAISQAVKSGTGCAQIQDPAVRSDCEIIVTHAAQEARERRVRMLVEPFLQYVPEP